MKTITKIEKYLTDDGFEFYSIEDAERHVNNRVDKHGKWIKVGDMIKESWYFHGFRGYDLFSITEFKNKEKSFRFATFKKGIALNINRVNRQGWPVSDYEVEIVTKEYADSFKNNPDYIYSGDKEYSRPPFYYTKKTQTLL